MAGSYTRGDVVSVPNPYPETKPRTAVILTDHRRPQQNDGKYRYTLVLLTGDVDEFGDHDWTVTLDKNTATKNGHPSLMKTSVITPWAHYVVTESTIIDGPHTVLTDGSLKQIGRAYLAMVMQ